MRVHDVHQFRLAAYPFRASFGRIKPTPCRIISVSKGSNKQLDQYCNQWIEKCCNYGKVTETRIKTNPRGTSKSSVQVADEGLKILKNIKDEEFLILLDEGGRDVNSIEFAELLAKLSEERRQIVFCVGGPYGSSDSVKQRANLQIRLSSLVLNHEIARCVILEQIYRAWTIIAGHPYHH